MPKKCWLISDEDVQIIRESLVHATHVRKEKALHALDSGLHKTDEIPDDWKPEVQSSYPDVIDRILALSKDLLGLMEEKIGPPQPLSYLSTGYIGPDKFISDTTDIESNLLRSRAIIRGSPTSTKRPFKPDRSTQSAVTEEFKKEEEQSCF